MNQIIINGTTINLTLVHRETNDESHTYHFETDQANVMMVTVAVPVENDPINQDIDVRD